MSRRTSGRPTAAGARRQRAECDTRARTEAFDRLADHAERRLDTSPCTALSDRPAVLAALGPVEGLDVLDVARGPGVYAAELVGRGATVSAFDASTAMVERARVRLGAASVVRRARLDEALAYPDGGWWSATSRSTTRRIGG